jgi:hypothetical protein
VNPAALADAPDFPETESRTRCRAHLDAELVDLLANALLEDLRQYPTLADIPPVTEATVESRWGADHPGTRGRRRPDAAA